MKTAWSRAALRDVASIYAYIDGENPFAAARVTRELLLAGDSLSMFPRRGRVIAGTDKRELLAVYPYVLVYRIARNETAQILRVWHAAQERSY